MEHDHNYKPYYKKYSNRELLELVECLEEELRANDWRCLWMTLLLNTATALTTWALLKFW